MGRIGQYELFPERGKVGRRVGQIDVIELAVRICLAAVQESDIVTADPASKPGALHLAHVAHKPEQRQARRRRRLPPKLLTAQAPAFVQQCLALVVQPGLEHRPFVPDQGRVGPANLGRCPHHERSMQAALRTGQRNSPACSSAEACNASWCCRFRHRASVTTSKMTQRVASLHAGRGPDVQRRGVGLALTQFALLCIVEAGYPLATVGTGGDPGHAPARRTYERAGFSPIPVVHYFQALKPKVGRVAQSRPWPAAAQRGRSTRLRDRHACGGDGIR